MPRGEQTTLTAVTPPTVLTIGCPPEIQERCARALGSFASILRHCELAQAPNVVAMRRPLAIVIPQVVYDFDPQEIDALARDVGASLLRVEDDMPEELLEMLLGAAIDAAIARREKQGIVVAGFDNPQGGPASWRTTVPRRRSWMDLEAPPPSQGAGRA